MKASIRKPYAGPSMKIKPKISVDLPTYVSTKDAAGYLNRKVGTLHRWSCLGAGPIAPIKIYGRLGWRLSELAALLKA
jgi:hypothetical protein